MILEGIVTTRGEQDELHVAPMGPEIDDGPVTRFVLKPFQTSATFQNLRRTREGVLHITDDVLLLAQAAIGPVQAPVQAAELVQVPRLSDCCRYFEFRVQEIDEREPRTRITCEVVLERGIRDFFGFNRAKHGIIELAILATRLHLVPRIDILSEVDRWTGIIEKTGGSAERSALAIISQYVRQDANTGT